MAALELSEALERAGQKSGEPGRNKTGKQGSVMLRRHSRALANALFEEYQRECDVPGYEGMSNWRAMIKGIVAKTLPPDPERWACVFTRTSMFGRAPLVIEVDDHRRDLSSLSPEEFAAHIDRLRASLPLDVAPSPPTPQAVSEQEPEPPETPQVEPEPPETPEQPAEEPERTAAVSPPPPAPLRLVDAVSRRATATIVQRIDPQTGLERSPVHLDNPYVI